MLIYGDPQPPNGGFKKVVLNFIKIENFQRTSLEPPFGGRGSGKRSNNHDIY